MKYIPQNMNAPEILKKIEKVKDEIQKLLDDVSRQQEKFNRLLKLPSNKKREEEKKLLAHKINIFQKEIVLMEKEEERLHKELSKVLGEDENSEPPSDEITDDEETPPEGDSPIEEKPNPSPQNPTPPTVPAGTYSLRECRLWGHKKQRKLIIQCEQGIASLEKIPKEKRSAGEEMRLKQAKKELKMNEKRMEEINQSVTACQDKNGFTSCRQCPLRDIVLQSH